MVKEDVRSVGIALLGSGTVGSSVIGILRKRVDELVARFGVRFDVRKILVRNIDKERSVDIPDGTLTTEIDEVLGDPQVRVVLELMGGTDPAFDYISQAIRTGRPVVTANKHLLALRGPELEALSIQEKVPLRFEATVGALIPVVSALGYGVNAFNVKRIRGILNGTTNFILSYMFQEDVDFEEALRMAQNEGIAEQDPTLDISGMDSAHKLCVLSRLVLGKFIPLNEVVVEGITPDIKRMVKGAKHFGKKVKLVSELYLGDTSVVVERPGAHVRPMEIKQDDCFYRIDGTNNIIEIETFDAGKIELTGRGAGGTETATAVISDLLSIVSNLPD